MRDNSENSREINLDMLRRGIVDACDAIAVALLGKPSYQDRREMRWGSKGSFCLDLGRKRGLWYDHEQGDGGDIIALVERELRCDFRSACEWLAGHAEGAHGERVGSASPAQPDAQRVDYARRLWAVGRPIAFSAGEAYFGGRGLSLPEPVRLRLRYHEGKRAVIAAFRSMTTREVTGIQLIPIDGSRKTSHGVLKGSAVMLLPGPGVNTLTVTEGIATALGAIRAGVVEGACWALGGTSGLGRLPVLDFDRLVIAADNDTGGRHAAQEAKQRWEEAGKTVEVILPAQWGKDWADA